MSGQTLVIRLVKAEKPNHEAKNTLAEKKRKTPARMQERIQYTTLQDVLFLKRQEYAPPTAIPSTAYRITDDFQG